MGTLYAIVGVIIVVVLTGIGSSFGVSYASNAAAGVVSEDPDKFGKTMVLQLLPSTNALYGFIVGLILLLVKVLGADITKELGMIYMALCVPLGVIGIFSGVIQGRIIASCINMVNKKPETSGRAMIMAAFSEMFLLLAFITSIMGVLMF